MHASSSISISSYLNLFETSLNHSIDITNTLTYPWTKSTIAAPLPLVFSVWEKVEKEIHARFLFNNKIGAAAPPPAPARASHSLCPPLTLSPPNPTNRSPPSTLSCPKPTLPPYTITTPFIRPQTTPAPLCSPISLLHHHLTLPKHRDASHGSVPDEGRRTLLPDLRR
jgi:hypothetical protein